MKFKQINYKSAPVFITVLLGSLLLLLSSTQAVADMFSFFKKYDVHLCPEVHGQITLEGKPIPNLEVIRGLTYGDDDELVDKAMTDEQGRFLFPEKNIRSRKPGSMFDESRRRQTIGVVHRGQQYVLWYTQSIGIEANKNLTDKLNYLNCDLNNSEEKIKIKNHEYPQGNHLIHSICRW
ncbi:DUF4198 domain-containing protein [Psychromonas antarctica]|uniref:DUF4198 domain-containing protein n=1 Tax=Psychromonas antarctica TaxID=67573 RepID=UPI001EE791E1|nr:DUF4198 domain-containing protein [Psychromonas antarctica]MCG6202832.1 DUF4198 domain-containing protein [Psychromonas antarctica]